MRPLLRSLAILLAVGLLAGAAGATLAAFNRTPGELAPYVFHRTRGHNPAIEFAGDLVTRGLLWADGRAASPLTADLDWAGAHRTERAAGAPDPQAPDPQAIIRVASMDSLAHAMSSATPGRVIEIAAGEYTFSGHLLKANAGGAADRPITLRAAHLGDVVLHAGTDEAINVSAPYWIFENLEIRGACGADDDDSCEHAFHIVGDAHDTVLRNNRLVDWNAAIKINGQDGKQPDDGLIEGNTIENTRPRMTVRSVALIDLVDASDWRITRNLIADFAKAYGGGEAYGAYAKGGGSNTIFADNAVICDRRIAGFIGKQVGLSLGGGGTGEGLCRYGHCISEQTGGRIEGNVIASCSDVGIYLNKAAKSVIRGNTLLQTVGIDARYGETAALVTGNIVDGVIRARDDAIIHQESNSEPYLLALFFGYHPQRGFYRDVSAFDLRWRGAAPTDRRLSLSGTDLCGADRSGSHVIGAFDNFAKC